MAEGARRVLGADVGIAVTGVAGPTEQDGVAVGTVCFGIALPDGTVEAVTHAPARRPRAGAPVLDDLAAQPAAPAPRRAALGDPRVRRRAAARRGARRGRASASRSCEFRAGATTRDQWHLTLQFLGNDADVDAVVAALDGARRARRPVRLGGAGAFPDARARLGAVARCAPKAPTCSRGSPTRWRERLAPLGHEREARPFRPHLTLARCRAPTDLRARDRGARRRAGRSARGRVDAVTRLREPDCGADGARYVERATIPLTGLNGASTGIGLRRDLQLVEPEHADRAAVGVVDERRQARPRTTSVAGASARHARETARAARASARSCTCALVPRVGRRTPRRGAAARWGCRPTRGAASARRSGRRRRRWSSRGRCWATGRMSSPTVRPSSVRSRRAVLSSWRDALSTNKPTSAVKKKS